MVLHKYVTLVAYVMIVKNIPFLITMSRGIKFVAVKRIPSIMDNQLRKKLNMIMDLYSRGSMIVQTILMDPEFYFTKDELMGKTVVKTSAAK